MPAPPPAQNFDGATALFEGNPQPGSKIQGHKALRWKPLLSESRAEANTPLSGGPVRRDRWMYATAKFLLCRISETEYFSFPPPAYKDFEPRHKFWPAGKHSAEALFFAGVKELVAGDKARAVKYFRECETADGPPDLLERELSRAELKLADRED